MSLMDKVKNALRRPNTKVTAVKNAPTPTAARVRAARTVQAAVDAAAVAAAEKQEDTPVEETPVDGVVVVEETTEAPLPPPPPAPPAPTKKKAVPAPVAVPTPVEAAVVPAVVPAKVPATPTIPKAPEVPGTLKAAARKVISFGRKLTGTTDQEKPMTAIPPVTSRSSRSGGLTKLQDEVEQIRTDLGGLSPAAHTHEEFAAADHVHPVAPHTHAAFAATEHTHDGFAATEHTHEGFAAEGHTHNFDMSDYAPKEETDASFASIQALVDANKIAVADVNAAMAAQDYAGLQVAVAQLTAFGNELSETVEASLTAINQQIADLQTKSDMSAVTASLASVQEMVAQHRDVLATHATAIQEMQDDLFGEEGQ